MPLVARWPAKIPTGRVSDDCLTTLELLPTLAAAAGATPDKETLLDGFDMLPVLQGKTPSPRTEMFWERQHDRARDLGDRRIREAILRHRRRRPEPLAGLDEERALADVRARVAVPVEERTPLVHGDGLRAEQRQDR